MQKEHNPAVGEHHQYVGPFRLEKTLGKGQTGEVNPRTVPVTVRTQTEAPVGLKNGRYPLALRATRLATFQIAIVI